MTSVTITNDEFREAEGLADETMEIFGKKKGFYPNEYQSHLRGKTGEIAVTNVLQARLSNVLALWKDIAKLRCADIEVPGQFRADVKTWNEIFYEEWGRCVAVKQFSRLEVKADVVIWSYTTSELETNMTVTLDGWNTLADIKNAPQRFTGPKSSQVFNYQVDQSNVRQLIDLFSYVV